MSQEWTGLRIAAEMYEDVQKARIAANNRAKRGGIDRHDFEIPFDALKGAEDQFGERMRQEYKLVVPAEIRAWQKDTIGIGEHLLARLLGMIGHPVHTTPHWWEGKGEDRILMKGEPFDRSVSQLWSYCGHGDSTRKRRKGMTKEEAFAMGNPRAKMILHLLAESACKLDGVPDKNGKARSRSPYRDVYDKRKAATERYTHVIECVRCGPSGKPAQPGSDWSKAHRHADALRIVGKEILRDLWRVVGGKTIDPA